MPPQPMPDMSDMDDEPPEDPPDWENYASGSGCLCGQNLVMHAPDLPEEQPFAAGDRPLSG